MTLLFQNKLYEDVLQIVAGKRDPQLIPYQPSLSQPSLPLSASTSQQASSSSEQNMMDVLLEVREMVRSLCGSTLTTVKDEHDQKFIVSDGLLFFHVSSIYLLQVNGVDLLKIPAKDICAYGRCLLDVLFTREEQAVSVVKKTNKSKKPPLSPSRVQKLFGKLIMSLFLCSYRDTVKPVLSDHVQTAF